MASETPLSSTPSPHNIFCIAKIKPPAQIIAEINRIPNTTYTFFYEHISVYTKYITGAPIYISTGNSDNSEKVPLISCADFAALSDVMQKMVFILYYLYLNGGIHTDLKVIPTANISTLDWSSISILYVKSIMNTDHLFMGILAAKRGDPILIDIIKQLLVPDATATTATIATAVAAVAAATPENDKTDSGVSALATAKALLRISSIFNSKNMEQLPNTLGLNEKRLPEYPNAVSAVYNDTGEDTRAEISRLNVPLFNHYFDDMHYYRYPLPEKAELSLQSQLQPQSLKIGLTLTLFDNVGKFFSNGINQNSLYLCELLLNIGYDVYFIINDMDLLKITGNLDEIVKSQLYDSRFKYVRYSDILSIKFDMIITLSFSDSNLYIHNYLRYAGTKMVGYFCGNSYIIDTETILYNQHKNRPNNYDFTVHGQLKFDEIWCIPQMADTNFHYWKILYRCPVKTVPFVWSTSAIRLHSTVNNCTETDLYYKPRDANKGRKIAIFEPNISIMKWALPSILICEDSYRTTAQLTPRVSHVYVTNISDSKIVDFNKDQFNKLMGNLDIVKDKKCSIESRYNTMEFMSKIADVAVSHQWGNPLNYLYLDLAWLGYPIIHNAELCKDVGYYYPDFDLTAGSNMLTYVLTHHDAHIPEYTAHNRQLIDRYLPTNYVLMQKYTQLIEAVLHK